MTVTNTGLIPITQVGTSAASVLNLYVNLVDPEALAWRFYFVYIAILVIECFWYVASTLLPALCQAAKILQHLVPFRRDQGPDSGGDCGALRWSQGTGRPGYGKEGR